MHRLHPLGIEGRNPFHDLTHRRFVREGRRPFESLLEILLDFPVWRRLRASVGSAAETVDLAVCALRGVLGERADARPAAAAPSSR